MEGGERRYSVARLSGAAGGVLRANPALGPALLATATFVALGASEAGFYPTTWYAAALFLLGLLAVSMFALGIPRGVPRLALVALALLAAYTAWSYLSITWASQQGPALDGANRNALYLLVFAQFALWPFDSRGASAVLGVLGLGIAGLGLVELLRADAAADPASYFIDVRFAEPAGYMNANAALWTLGLLPCLFLASRRGVPAGLRGLALGGAGLLGALALLGQSRGWALALPLALAFLVAVCPGRVRLLAASGAVALGVLAASGPVLAVHDDYSPARLDALMSDATGRILLVTAVLALAGIAWALLDRRVEPGPAASRRIGLAAAGLVALALVGGLAAYAVAEGSPTAKLADAWDDFKEGGAGPQAGASRFGGGGTNRYDFWTVAWDAFSDEPLRGIGVENFQEEYLQRGDSDEQPRYAHSLELGALSQTGIVGGLLLFAALACGALAALRARAAPPAGRAAAAGAAAVFAYWLLHASVDWFWEFPALTAPALAGLAMAGALAARPDEAAEPRPARTRSRPALVAAAAVPAAALALAFALPWLADREVDRAIDIWRADADAAFRRLDRADDLNPLSPRASLTSGTIALRVGRLGLAREEFEQALEREPRNAYALLELGAIAAEDGDRASALRLIRRAEALSPRDEDIRWASRRLQQRRPMDLQLLNERIRDRARVRESD